MLNEMFKQKYRFIIDPRIRDRRRYGLIDDISSIVIHLGINPVNGGNPPRDKMRRGNVIFIFVDFIMLFIFILYVEDMDCSIEKIGVINKEYIIKQEIDRMGLLIEISAIIHPIWVIDEQAIIDRNWD